MFQTEANKQALEANRRLLNATALLQAEQNTALLESVETIAQSFAGLAQRLRQRHQATIQLLEKQAAELENRAQRMPRKGAAKVLQQAADDIKITIEQLKAEGNKDV